MTTEQYRKRSGFSIFLSFFKPHRGLFFLDMACALVVSMIDLAYPIISRYAMRTLLPQSAYRTFFTIMLIVLAAYALRSVLYFIITYWGHTFGIRVEADIRAALFGHMQELGFEFFDRNRTGQLMSRMTTDLFEITELAHHGPEDLFISLVTIVLTDYTEGLASVQLTGLSTEGDNPDIIVPYDKGSNTYTAIVAPQSVAAGTTFIVCTFTNGKTFVYKMKNATDWQAGGEYTYTVSLAAAKDLGYTIESNGSYTVTSADGLMNIAELVNGGKSDINITLDTDIDLTGKDWTPIGTDYDNSYKGTFDGGGHTITGLTFTTNDEYAGLFGWLNRAGTVKNVVMEGVQITSHQIYGGSIGGVVGSGWGTIENCSVSGSVSGTVYVGGVVGVQIGGSITGCSSSATVKGMVDVGGVAGQTNSSATLTACYATGNVIIEMDPKKNIAGGSLVGMNAGSSLLACYATGNVTSTGSSTGYMHIGGFLGNNYTTVTAGYWKNNHEQGIGYNRESTGATKVDGSVVTWQKAVDAMNTALQNAGSEWRYELNGALPTLRKL